MPISVLLFRRYSCTALLFFPLIQCTGSCSLHTSHPLSSMPVSSDLLFRHYSCTALLFLLFIQCAGSCLFHVSHLRFIHSCVASCFYFHVSARLYSLMRCILSLLSCNCFLSLLVSISHEALSLPDLFFSLTYIKTGTQLYVQEIRADEYKTPRWPIRSLFSLVHIARIYIFHQSIFFTVMSPEIAILIRPDNQDLPLHFTPIYLFFFFFLS